MIAGSTACLVMVMLTRKTEIIERLANADQNAARPACEYDCRPGFAASHHGVTWPAPSAPARTPSILLCVSAYFF